MSNEGIKFDAGKPRMDLLDFEALEGLAKVLSYGAAKYTKKGDCDCHVNFVTEILKFGPEDFVKLVMTKISNKEILNMLPNKNKTHESGYLTTLKSINLLSKEDRQNKLLTLLLNIDDLNGLLKESTIFQMQSTILCLHKLLVQFVDQNINYVLTTTIKQEQLEKDFAKDVTLHWDSLKELNGSLEHSSICKSMETIDGTNNWRLGINNSRLVASLLRHLSAYQRGENIDPESGLSHLDHIGANWMFLSANVKQRPHLDDRFVPPSICN